VAYAIGALLRRLGQKTQVIAVTHAAQVAACAHNHYHVSKQSNTDNGQALTSVKALDGEARIEELARMIGGASVTATTKEHARELLLAGSF
jgi:DNA repair protein RecN (Recombination protein N)